MKGIRSRKAGEMSREESAKKRILKLLMDNVGRVVPRERIIAVADSSEWARRIRELREAGWEIESQQIGYRLASETKRSSSTVRSHISKKQRYRILLRDQSKCRRCGRTIDDGVKLVVDHIIPIAWGGGTKEDSNLWTLCEDCNQGKKAWESDADAATMRQLFGIRGSRDRLRAFFKLKPGVPCTREELQIVSGISEYARRIRELREEGMNITVVHSRGDYVYKP